jgi:HAD superfamily hydrolase (TIGR01509 family)
VLTPSTERPVLLLDVMDTLVLDPFHEAIPRFFGLTFAEFMAEKHPTAWVEFEKGELQPEEYAANMFLDRRPVSWSAFEAHVREAYAFLPGIESLLLELRDAGVEMHALSNYPVLYRVLDEAVGLSRFVSLSFVSCETRRRKPDPAAYLQAAATLGRSPDACLFIDDRASNCAAAEAVGMPSIVFRGAPSLRAELVRRGVL